MAVEILPIPKIPDGVVVAAQMGALVPFVGAGVSGLAGCPGWAGMADSALNQMIEQGRLSYADIEQTRHLQPRVKLSIAELVASEHKLEINYKKILESTGWQSDEKGLDEKGLEIYSELDKLGQRFVTTNYDRWLDYRYQPTPAHVTGDATGETNPGYAERRWFITTQDFTAAHFLEPETVIHLHGSLRDRRSMILTTRDYIRHYANDRRFGEAREENRVLTFLEHLFETKTVLFVGYGLEDLEILEYIVQKARGMAGGQRAMRHYMLQGFFAHETSLAISLRTYYREECGIELIPFLRDHKDYDQLIDVVREFARQIPAKDPAKLQDFAEMEALLR